MQAIPCIFCHSLSAPTVVEENGYQGKKCDTCNLIYISPRPSLEEINNLYGHDQAHLSAHSHIAQEYPKSLHALYTLEIIKKYLPAGNLLELGSGAGYFLTHAQQAGFLPHGIELNPVQAKFIREKLHIPCLETPLDENSFGEKQFDIIYHSDVLSHFYDPINAVQTIASKLKPGGYMVFETGNIADISPRYYSAFNALQYPDHLFFFGRKSLEKLLSITSFTLKEYRSYAILPQLRIMKALKKLKNLAGTKDFAPAPKAHEPSAPYAQSALKRVARMAYYTAMHMIRYRLGSMLPRQNKPQTVIIVAQKNNPPPY